MTTLKSVAIGIGLLAATMSTSVQGRPARIYGVIEKVIIDPDESRALEARLQVWGVFATVDGTSVSEVKRGYLFFYAPYPYPGTNRVVPEAISQWKDIKDVAGTGQIVSFGRWENVETEAAFRVRSESERLADPALYHTNRFDKVSEQGPDAELLNKLRSAAQQ